MAVKFVALVSLALSVAACAQTPSESPAPSNQSGGSTRRIVRSCLQAA